MNIRQILRPWTAALGTGAIALTMAAAPGTAAGATRGSDETLAGLPVYLALGDSIAAGEESVAPNGDYWQTAAAWKANGYTAQFFDSLVEDLDCLPATTALLAADGCRQLQSVNLARSAVPALDGQPARSGVTSATLVAEQLPVAVGLLKSRNQDANPRNDVEVVTVTVGGNDIFGPVIGACLGGVTTACSTAIQTSFASFAGNYAATLAQLRAAAGPETTIVTMTYYNPLPYCHYGQIPGATQLADYVLESVPVSGVGPVGFNGLIAAISGSQDAVVVDTYGALGAGDFVGGSDCLHPNASGHAKIAALFADSVDE